jgi:hypothetical protein
MVDVIAIISYKRKVIDIHSRHYHSGSFVDAWATKQAIIKETVSRELRWAKCGITRYVFLKRQVSGAVLFPPLEQSGTMGM